MKRILFVLQLVICFTVYSNNEEPLQILTQDWPPYNYYENGKIKGFSTEVVRYIMNDLSIKSKIRLLSDARAVQQAMVNSNMIYFTMFRTPEREKNYKWIGPISNEKLYFYKKKGSSLKINSLEDAKVVKRVSVRNQGLVYAHLKKNGFDNLDTSHNNESLYLKILNGRDDLVIGEPELGVRYLLNKLKYSYDSLERTDVSLLQFDLYIAASFEVPDEEIARWQNSLDKMKASGEYDKLYQLYMR